MSLNVGQMAPSIFTSEDRLLTAKRVIIIDSHILTAFYKVVEKVETEQDYVQHGNFIGRPMIIKLSFKCKVSSMTFWLEVFPNDDVNYINIRGKPQYYTMQQSRC